MEHVWDELKRRVRVQNSIPGTINDRMKMALVEESEIIPQEKLRNSYEWYFLMILRQRNDQVH